MDYILQCLGDCAPQTPCYFASTLLETLFLVHLMRDLMCLRVELISSTPRITHSDQLAIV